MFWPKTATFLCRCTFHLYENNENNNKNAIQSENFFEPVSVSTCKEEKKAKMHTCFSK